MAQQEDSTLDTWKLRKLFHAKSFLFSCEVLRFAVLLPPLSQEGHLTFDYINMEDQKQQIINKALEQFKQFGIKSVSVDDICRELGMSKKTFYIFFPGKDELVAEVLQKMNYDVECAAGKYMHGKSALECIRIIMNMHENVSDVHREPPMLYDLKKYYTKLYKQHIFNVHKGTKEILVRHLQQGVDEGVYRSDLDVEMCAIMFSLIQQSFIRNEEDMKNINPRRLARFTMESFVRSIVSEEGARQIEETINNNKNKVQK